MLEIAFMDEGVEKSIQVPISTNQISYSNWLDHLVVREKWLNLDGDYKEYVWATYCKEMLKPLVQGDLSPIPAMSETDTKGKGLLDGKPSLSNIFSFIDDIVKSHQSPKSNGKSFSFMYNGCRYYLSGKEWKGVLANNKFTNGEVLTAVETVGFFDKLIKENGDSDMSYQFQKDLTLMAILCRKKNEKLPSMLPDRLEFLQKRSEEFLQLPMDVVLDVTFFLTSIFLALKKETIYEHSMMLQSLLRGGAVGNKGGRSKKQNAIPVKYKSGSKSK